MTPTMSNYLTPQEVRRLVKAKGTKFASVVFKKKDGTLRKKTGLFRPTSKIKGTGRPTPKGYIAIYSPGEGKWGIFRDDAVVEFK